jgi:hypothetical protein
VLRAELSDWLRIASDSAPKARPVQTAGKLSELNIKRIRSALVLGLIRRWMSYDSEDAA